MSQSAPESTQTPDLVALPMPEDDEVERADVTERFLDALSKYHSGWFVLVGGPGTGKSVVLSQVLRRMRRTEGFDGVVALAHCFERASPRGRNMTVIGRTLEREIRRTLRVRNPGLALFETIRSLDKANSGRPRLLLVLDGLDAARFAQGEGLRDYLPADLPDGVQVLCSTRRTEALDYLRAARDSRLRVDLDAKESARSNVALVRRYWEQQQQRFPDQFAKQFTLAAIKACGGQILYAAMLSRWARAHGRRLDLGQLPTDLAAFLDQVWNDFKDLPLVTSGMGYFCASREPLTRSDLQAVSGWSALEVDEVLKRVKPLLRDEPGVEVRYSLFHEAFRDHLVRNFYGRDLAKYSEHFIALLGPTISQMQAGSSPAAGPCFGLLADYAHHLIRCDRAEEALSLASTVDFLAALAETVGVLSVLDLLRTTSALPAENGTPLSKKKECLSLVYAEVSQQIFRLTVSSANQIGGDIASVAFNALALAGWPQHEIREHLKFRKRAPVLRLLRPAQTTTGWKNAFSLAGLRVVELAASADELDVFFVIAEDGSITRNNGRSGVSEELQKLSYNPATAAFATQANVALVGAGREVWRVNILTGDASKLGAHAAAVTHCAVTEDASWGASIDSFGNLEWWGSVDGTARPRPRVSGTVTCLAISEEPPRMAAVSDGSALIFDKLSKEPHRKLGEGVLSAAFSSDGKAIALGTVEGDLVLAELEGGVSRSWRAHQGAISACTISGDRIVTGGHDRTVAVWNSKGELLDRFRGHLFGIARVAVTQERKLVLSAGLNGAVLSWGMPTGTTPEPPASWLDCSVVRPPVQSQRSRADQSPPIVAYLASVSGDRVLRLWVGTEHDFTRRNLGPARFQCCAISPGADWVAAGTTTGEVFLYATAGAKLVSSRQVHDAAVRACAWTVDQQYVATVGDDRRIVVHQTDGEYSVLGVHGAEVRACAFNDDVEPKLFTVASNGEVMQWAIGQRRPLQRARLESPGICCARRGKGVVIGCEDGSVVEWHGSTAPARSFSHETPVEAIAVVGIGAHVVVGGSDEAISVWEVARKACVGRMFTPARVFCINADDDLIVAGDSAGNLYAIDFVARNPPTE